MGIVSFFLLCTPIFMVGAFKSSNSSPLRGKLLGGEDAFPGEIRYMVYFVHRGQFKTNAFMITSKNALVPAHSLKSFFLDCPPPDFSEYSIILNGYQYDESKKELYQIEQVEHISGFFPSNPHLSHDIAVIKLRQAINLRSSTWIDPPRSIEDSKVGLVTTLAIGWGVALIQGELTIKKVPIRRFRNKTDCGVPNETFVYCVQANAKFYLEDLGTPLIVRGRPVGIMTATVKRKRNLAVYTQIYKHNEPIELLRTRVRTHTPYNAPRKYARFDWQSFSHWTDNKSPNIHTRYF